jgi:predicted HicB family RNase H-like nuclease
MSTSEKKGEELRRQAELLYSQRPHWATFYRQILGLHGMVRRSYTTRESLKQFEQTEAYSRIQQMLTRLRMQRPPSKDGAEATKSGAEPTKVVTVRLPKSLHDALKVEAHEHHTTMNKLCISKLLQFVAQHMIPAEPWTGPGLAEEKKESGVDL